MRTRSRIERTNINTRWTTSTHKLILREGRLLRETAVEARDVDVRHGAVGIVRDGRLEVDTMGRRSGVLVGHVDAGRGLVVVVRAGEVRMRVSLMLMRVSCA